MTKQWLWLIAALIILAAISAPARSGARSSGDVFTGGREGYPVYRIPALVRSGSGVLLAFCEGRKTGILDHGNIDIVLKRSFDDGQTWGPLQVVVSEGFVTWGNPAPVVDRSTGRIWLPFCLDNDRVFVSFSDDDGATWSEPREITGDVKPPGWGWYATGPGHAIQLNSGRLLVPCDHREDGQMFSHIIYSDDHGETWKLGGILDPGTDECMAVELGDGSVYLTMRNIYGKKRRAYSTSNDGGLTWAKVQVEDQLVCPTCQAGILRLTNERLVFSNPASEQRENLSIRISADNGHTWSDPNPVHSGPGAYSDLVELPGPAVGVLFENGSIWPYSRITFARVEIGKPAGEKVNP